MHSQRGMTLIELLMVVAMATLLLVAAAAYSVPWMAKEAMRSAVYDVQTYFQLARIEAVSRNQETRFVVDTANGQLIVFDTNGTAGTGDDTELYRTSLASSVTFARPDAGVAVTLTQIGASDSYQVRFTSDGTVAAGAGDICLFGGQQFGRISIFAAGGTQVASWKNGAWYVGS